MITASTVLCSRLYVTLKTHKSLIRLAQYRGDDIRWLFIENDDALIQRSRDLAATRFFEDESLGEILLFIDDDIIFDLRDANRIVHQCAKTKGIVGGLYSTRAQGKQFLPIRFLSTKIEFVNSNLIECETVSGGFMAIHREVFEKLKDKVRHFQSKVDPEIAFYDWFRPFITDGGIFMSEDWSICILAREYGIPVHADPGIMVGHLGTKVYTVPEALREMESNGRISLL